MRLAPENSARNTHSLPFAEKYNVPLLRFAMSPYCDSGMRHSRGVPPAGLHGAKLSMLRRPDRRFSPEGWQKIAGGKPAPPPEHPPNVASHPDGVTDQRGGPLNTDSTCNRPPKIRQGTHRLFPTPKSTMSPYCDSRLFPAQKSTMSPYCDSSE